MHQPTNQDVLEEIRAKAAWVEALQHQILRVRDAVHAGHARRSVSIMARLACMLSKNSGEQLIDQLHAQLRITIDGGTERAREWLDGMLADVLDRDPAIQAQISQLEDKVAAVSAQYERLDHWKALTEDASCALLSARSACSSARGTEVWDVLSTSKLASFASSATSWSASSEVREAERALQRLEEALKSGRGTKLADYWGDWPDLAVDLVSAPSLDVLSLLNLSRLNDVVRVLEKAQDRVMTLAMELDRMAHQVDRVLDDLKEELDSIGKPYRDALLEMIPPVFRPDVLQETWEGKGLCHV